MLHKNDIAKIIYLRERGHSLPEIHRITKRSKSTVYRYIHNVKVLPDYVDVLKTKQGGSKARAEKNWLEARAKVSKEILPLDRKSKMIILACLYWGEGNKTEFNVINGDASMINVVVSCLLDLGVKKSDLKFSLRLYEDINRVDAISFWAKTLGVNKNEIKISDVLFGKKTGKLKYGMCRLRIRKGAPYFKMVMSMVNLIKSEF